jgi:hypothetical protein
MVCTDIAARGLDIPEVFIFADALNMFLKLWCELGLD